MPTRELILFQEHHITSRASAAKRLRDLADKVEAMTFTLGDHQIALPEQVNFKVEYDQENPAGDNTGAPVYELELEIRWEPWGKMPATRIAEG